MIAWFQTQANRLSKGFVPGPASSQGVKRVLLVHAHPVQDSYSAALAQAATEGLERAGHEVDVLKLYDVDGKGNAFQPCLTADERKEYTTVYPTPSSDVAPIVERLKRADALVLVYPTWWFNVPAILKGFFDRVFLPGVAFRLPHLEPEAADQLKLRDLGLLPNLSNIKKVACVTTYGSPQHIVFLAGDNGRSMISRAFVSLMADTCTLTWIGLYNMDYQDLSSRQKFIEDVRGTMANF